MFFFELIEESLADTRYNRANFGRTQFILSDARMYKKVPDERLPELACVNYVCLCFTMRMRQLTKIIDQICSSSSAQCRDSRHASAWLQGICYDCWIYMI
jgi:hypothetical protein